MSTGMHEVPPPTGPLPELDQDERRMALRLARMVKAGELFSYGMRRHDKEEKLQVTWSNDGGACLAD